MNTLSACDSSECILHSGKLWLSCKYEILSTTCPPPLCDPSPSSSSSSSESSDKFLSHQTLNSSSSTNLITSSALKSLSTHLFFTLLWDRASLSAILELCYFLQRGTYSTSLEQPATAWNDVFPHEYWHKRYLTFWLVHNGIPPAKSRSRKIRWLTRTYIYVPGQAGSRVFNVYIRPRAV